jgi:adenylate cyclase
MEGKIVTINDAALQLLGCPLKEANPKNNKHLWEQNLIGRFVWEVVPIDNLQFRLQDSLKTGAKHYVPEQSLTVGLVLVPSAECQVLNETKNSGLNNASAFKSGRHAHTADSSRIKTLYSGNTRSHQSRFFHSLESTYFTSLGVA